MATEIKPYSPVLPGQLISADLFNGVQTAIRQDILDRVHEAVAQIKHVDSAGDAQTLTGRTLEQITKDILDAALKEIPARTGYRRVFRNLRVGEQQVVEHGLKACPLVDVYQLEPFDVVCATGDTRDDQSKQTVNLFLYSTEERRLQLPDKSTYLDIEHRELARQYRVRFSDLLREYDVAYTDTTSLDDLEVDFWKALFAAPNDEFDPEQYCHSPWFEKCCGEKRTVQDLRQSGAWDDIWMKLVPRRTINYTAPAPTTTPPTTPPSVAPADVEVSHFDADAIGITLLQPATPPPTQRGLPVMLLLKV
jgi:hypothetical protein